MRVKKKGGGGRKWKMENETFKGNVGRYLPWVRIKLTIIVDYEVKNTLAPILLGHPFSMKRWSLNSYLQGDNLGAFYILYYFTISVHRKPGIRELAFGWRGTSVLVPMEKE